MQGPGAVARKHIGEQGGSQQQQQGIAWETDPGEKAAAEAAVSVCDPDNDDDDTVQDVWQRPSTTVQRFTDQESSGSMHQELSDNTHNQALWITKDDHSNDIERVAGGRAETDSTPNSGVVMGRDRGGSTGSNWENRSTTETTSGAPEEPVAGAVGKSIHEIATEKRKGTSSVSFYPRVSVIEFESRPARNLKSLLRIGKRRTDEVQTLQGE